MFLVGTAPGRDLPDDLATVMLRTLLDPGVTSIGTHHVLLVVQQFVDLCNVRNIGRRGHYAVHQSRLIVDTSVGFRAEVMLVSILGLVHFRVALAILVLGRTRRVNQRGIYDSALAQQQTAIPG